MTRVASSDFWIDRPVLVTGGTGLLGSWLVRRLAELRADVVCLVRDWVPQSELVRSGTIEQVRAVRGDVQDGDLLERILGEYEIASVFHLAAQTVVPVAGRNPSSTFASNITGTWQLLEACRRSPTVGEVAVASSDKAYGPQPTLPYTEDLPLVGRHPYDVSKSCADLIAQAYAATYDLPVAVARCGNLYGGGDLNWSRIVPGTIRSILRDRPPRIRSDGRYVRDYFYMDDAVDSYLLLVQGLARGPRLRGQAFNFSNEEPQTVLQLVRRILRLMDSDLKPVIQNRPFHEIPKQYLSAAKARRVLKWKPRFTLDEGLAATIEWYRALLQPSSA